MRVRVVERTSEGGVERCRLETPYGILEVPCQGATSVSDEHAGLEWTFDVQLRVGENLRLLDAPADEGIVQEPGALRICARVDAVDPDGLVVLRIATHGIVLIEVTGGVLHTGDLVELTVPLERTTASLYTL